MYGTMTIRVATAPFDTAPITFCAAAKSLILNLRLVHFTANILIIKQSLHRRHRSTRAKFI
jgi:hypothetical protein